MSKLPHWIAAIRGDEAPCLTSDAVSWFHLRGLAVASRVDIETGTLTGVGPARSEAVGQPE